MANLFQQAGGLFHNVGTKLNLPEFGVSEKLGFNPRPAAPAVPSSTGSSQLFAQPMSTAQSGALTSSPVPAGFGESPTNPQSGGGAPKTGQVLGARDGLFSTEGAPMEQAPSQPSFDFDAIIAPALQSLSQAEEAARAIFGAGESEIDSSRESQLNRLTQQKTSGEQELASRRTKSEGTAQSAIDEARRGFSEISQGLGNRFGAGSSTGLGASALVGREAIRNIAGIRAGLQESLNDIENTKTGLEEIFNNSVREVEASTTAMKNRARAELQQALAEIGQSRGQLQSRKAEYIQQAMDNYRSQVADVNARNASFQQDLYVRRQSAEQQLAEASQRATQKLSELQPFSLSAGETKFIPIQQFGDKEGFDKYAGTQLPGGVQSGTFGEYGVFSSPEKKSASGVEVPSQYQ